MGTAHPYKYADLVNKTLGLSLAEHAEESPMDEQVVEPGLASLRDVILNTVERNGT
jgi:hypothetical protein